MGRKPRILLPNVYHHVTQRGNRRMQTFFLEEEYELYIRLLFCNCQKFNVEIFSFCLMPNHSHLILRSEFGYPIRNAVADTHEFYTCAINARYGWKGHLWQGRFFSAPMSPEHLGAAYNYVALNPVRSGLAACPEDYQWSSSNKKYNNLVTSSGKVFNQNFSEKEMEEFRKYSKLGHAFGEKTFFEKIERKYQMRMLPGRSGRPKKYTNTNNTCMQ